MGAGRRPDHSRRTQSGPVPCSGAERWNKALDEVSVWLGGFLWAMRFTAEIRRGSTSPREAYTINHQCLDRKDPREKSVHRLHRDSMCASQVILTLLKRGRCRGSKQKSAQKQGGTEKEHEVVCPQELEVGMLCQVFEILRGITPLVMGQLIVVCSEKIECWRCHKQERSWAHTLVHLAKDFTMIWNMLENIKEKDDIPFFGPDNI